MLFALTLICDELVRCNNVRLGLVLGYVNVVV